MSHQQFVEPEWQSSQQRNVNTDPREQEMYNPQPFNVDPREKIQPMPKRRRRSRAWLWIVLIVIIVMALGAGMRASFGGPLNTTTETHTYTISGVPTLIVNDDIGSITIHRGGDDGRVTIEAIKHARAFGPAPSVELGEKGSAVIASVHSNGFFLGEGNVDFEITVPTNTNVQVHTDTGTIEANDISGSMSLTTDTGSINATGDHLSGNSVFKSDTGTITFNGSLDDPNGSYQFSTDTGSVDVTLPSNASFHVEAATDTGSITSEFSGVNIEHPDTVGSKASGDVGSSPTAQMTLKTNTGSIDLHKGE